MAGQLLPLLLLGGGAAVVATKAKKARKKKCPPEVRTTRGELNSATTRAQMKFKDESSAFKEAEFFVRSIMPKGCGPSSTGTRIKATFEIKKLNKSVDIDLSATDVYMLALGRAEGRRVAEGKITQEQAEKDWNEALGWYKKTAGKNFDISSLGLEVFEDLGGLLDDLSEGLKSGLGKGGKGKTEKDGCPAEYVFDVTPEINEKVQHMWEIGRAKYAMDPFKIADGIFASLVPPGCSKESGESVVKINVSPDAEPLGNHMKGYMGLPTFYAHLVANCIEGILEGGEGQFSNMDEGRNFLLQNMHELQQWHMQVTGSPLPPEWDAVVFLKAFEEGMI